MPLISVIIPVFNGKDTIQATLVSILEQTLEDFEIVIINDGSTDATLEVIAQIEDPRIKVFSYPNAGLSASRNRGIAKALGQFVAFIDADDLWTSDKLAAQYDALKNNPQAAVAYSWTDYIDEFGQFLRPGLHITAAEDAYEKLLISNILENGSNPLVRKEVFAEVGEFDLTLKANEDWDMWLRLAARYPFVAVPAVQVLYRMSSSSMSCDLQKMETEALKVISRAFENAPESLQFLKPKSILHLYQYLTFKALETPLTRQQGLAALGYWRFCLRQQPALLAQTKLATVVIVKILMALLLSPQQSQYLLKFIKSKAVRA